MRIQKSKPHAITKRNVSQHNLYSSDLDCVSAIPEPDLALRFFADVFYTIVNNHAPFKKLRVKKVDSMPSAHRNYQKSFIKGMMLGSRPETQA